MQMQTRSLSCCVIAFVSPVERAYQLRSSPAIVFTESWFARCARVSAMYSLHTHLLNSSTQHLCNSKTMPKQQERQQSCGVSPHQMSRTTSSEFLARLRLKTMVQEHAMRCRW